MSQDEREYSQSGGPIYRHDPEKAKSRLVGGGGVSTEEIQAHISKHVGNISDVYHELVSDLVHIDINMVAPSQTRNYYTLITSGMSDMQMPAPESSADCTHSELMMCLPPKWLLSEDSFKQEKNYWPIRWLKMLARLPHQYDTWLWVGHTVPNGNPPQRFASNTKLCCALLLRPILMPEEFLQLDVGGEKVIHFLSFIPIYREEMQFKLDKGLEPLVDRLDEANVSELLDISRVNVCKRSILGL